MTSRLMTAAEIRGKQRGRPFRKGQSGNPGGRPKETKAFKEWCREIMAKEGRDSLLTLAQAASDERVRLGAWRVIAEYAYGKPTQPVDATLNGNFGLANFLALAFEEPGAGSTRSVDGPIWAAGPRLRSRRAGDLTAAAGLPGRGRREVPAGDQVLDDPLQLPECDRIRDRAGMPDRRGPDRAAPDEDLLAQRHADPRLKLKPRQCHDVVKQR